VDVNDNTQTDCKMLQRENKNPPKKTEVFIVLRCELDERIDSVQGARLSIYPYTESGGSDNLAGFSLWSFAVSSPRMFCTTPCFLQAPRQKPESEPVLVVLKPGKNKSGLRAKSSPTQWYDPSLLKKERGRGHADGNYRLGTREIGRWIEDVGRWALGTRSNGCHLIRLPGMRWQ
jgi:hypothetical protein